MKLIIEDDEGRQTVVPFVRDEITIGRMEGNTIRLTERNVSRRHARLFRQNGHVLVEDVGSSYGIHVNGQRVREPVAIRAGDLIHIGDYELAIQDERASEPTTVRHRPEPPRTSEDDDDEGLPTASEPTAILSTDDPESALDDPSRRPTSVMRSPLAGEREVESLDPEHAPRLVVLNTWLAGREFSCIRTELRIGRSDENDISIDHPSLADVHARIARHGGVWTLVDLGSSKGVRHNDELCREAPLQNGDLFEIGTVRFKFLGPGVTFRFDPTAEYLPPKRSGGRMAIIGVLVFVLVGAGAAIGWRYTEHLPPFDRLRGHEDEVSTPSRPNAAAPAAQPQAVLAARALNLAAALQDAGQAIAERRFDRAVATLESIRQPSAEELARIQPLLVKARNERAAQTAIALAKDALGRSDFSAARSALAGAANSEAFRQERAELDHQITDGQANQLYERGREQLKAGKVRDAIETFTRCLTLEPTAARCHMLLGASYAQLASTDPSARAHGAELDQAVSHYRKFLQYAGPDETKEAQRVRAILRGYDGARK